MFLKSSKDDAVYLMFLKCSKDDAGDLKLTFSTTPSLQHIFFLIITK